MTRTQIKLQKIQLAEAARRRRKREIGIERKVSQLSGFIMTLAEGLDSWIPFGIAPGLGHIIVHRRYRRRCMAA